MKNLSRFCVLLFLLASLHLAYADSTADKKSGEQQGKETSQTSESSTEPKGKTDDPLGRSTPHGTVFGFLQDAQNGKYKEAAQYLQLSKRERVARGEQIARQLHFLMDNSFVGRVGTISDRREGSVPGDRERIGVFRINGNQTEVDLVLVSNPSAGDIWLFPSTLLAAVPDLYDQIETNDVDARLPLFLRTERMLSTPLWRLLAFLLLIPIAFALALATVKLLRGATRLWLRWKRSAVLEDVHNSLTAPVTLILTVLFHQLGVYLLGIPLLIRVYYHRLIGIILVASVAWLIFRLVNRWAERARLKALTDARHRNGSIVLLGQRILNVLVVIVAGLASLSILGFDISTVVAGLGIGSIAIAFAAQKTLENLLGGISILGDQVIRVGDFCRIGDQEGTVEDISLRSTRLRTPDRTELSVPNGQLANMNVENLSRRDKRLLETTIHLSQETSGEQLQSLMTDIRELIAIHPKIDPNVARVRLVGLGESDLEVEIHCHVLTASLDLFLTIREEILLQVMNIIADSGAKLAVPARVVYMQSERDTSHQRATSMGNATALRHGT